MAVNDDATLTRLDSGSVCLSLFQKYSINGVEDCVPLEWHFSLEGSGFMVAAEPGDLAYRRF